MLEQLKLDVFEGNLELPRHGLVTWTSGNLSARDPESGLIVIKPSGVRYQDMTVEDMVVVDPSGRVVEGHRGPSSDTSSHLGVYARRDDVLSIVHTHSTYATAFAATNQPIPCVLTAIADEFNGPVPIGAYAEIGGSAIGDEIVRSIGDSPAILMRQHGVFTIGKSIEAAIKAAVMVEDVARTVAIAMSIGSVTPLSEAAIASNYTRYQERYGTAAASEGVTV